MEYNTTSIFKIDNQSYTVNIYRRRREYIINIDGNDEQIIKIGYIDNRVDYHTQIDGHLISVRVGIKINIAIDGIYLESGHTFVPLLPFPSWGYLFIILNLLIPIYDYLSTKVINQLNFEQSSLLALSIILFIIGSLVTIHFARSPYSERLRFLYCLLTGTFAWGIFLILQFFI